MKMIGNKLYNMIDVTAQKQQSSVMAPVSHNPDVFIFSTGLNIFNVSQFDVPDLEVTRASEEVKSKRESSSQWII